MVSVDIIIYTFLFSQMLVLQESKYSLNYNSQLSDNRPVQQKPEPAEFYCSQREDDRMRYVSVFYSKISNPMINCDYIIATFRHSYGLIISRVLCEEVDSFKILKDSVPSVTTHRYSQITSRKSKVLSQEVSPMKVPDIKFGR